MKYEIKRTSKFKKDYKIIKKRKYNLKFFIEVLEVLESGGKLAPKYKDHSLTGEYSGCRECHITPDWLLIYRLHEDKLILVLTRIGAHSDLF